jgi:hypothetical protein
MGERLVLAEEQYQEHVNTYRHQMWAIRDQWYFMQERLKDMLYPNCELVYRDCITFLHRAIMPPNEIPLTYPRLRQLENGDFVYKEETKMYGGKLVENIIQNLARTVVAYQLLPIAAHYRAVLMVHDEGVFAVPAKQAKKCAADFMDSLSTPPDWAPDLPVAGEVGIFDHYVKM